MKWRSPIFAEPGQRPSRRQIIIGTGVGGALIGGFLLWPREEGPAVPMDPNERLFGGTIKLGADGHVTVVIPQTEFGQAATTLLPQIVADELGADWRTVGVEIAPINDLYASNVFPAQMGWHSWLGDPVGVQLTDEGTMLASFAAPMRAVAAALRLALVHAAAGQWQIDVSNCSTRDGFVVSGRLRTRFADLVSSIHPHALPKDAALRGDDDDGRLIGRSLPRLDAPSKVDLSQFCRRYSPTQHGICCSA